MQPPLSFPDEFRTKRRGAPGTIAVRWLRRLLEEDESLTIEEANLAAACLAALGGPSHEEALGMLLAMAERARQRAARQIAS
jgi:hypothetical protein